MRFDMGDVPGWIGGVGAAAAFLFASISYAYDLALRRKRGLRAQAQLVDAWIAGVRREQIDGGIRVIYDLTISNRSNTVIRGGRGEIAIGTELPQGVDVGIVPPNDSAGPFRKPCPLDYLGAASDREWGTDVPEDAAEIIGISRVAFGFTDSLGNRWRREFDGNLYLQSTAEQQFNQTLRQVFRAAGLDHPVRRRIGLIKRRIGLNRRA
ncbi:MAG: hypothetical protein ACRDP7_37065 [Trebonia sp.]